jgi:hypothetical protein
MIFVATNCLAIGAPEQLKIQLHYNYPMEIQGINKKNVMSKNQEIVL